MVQYTERCLEYVREQPIDAVLFSHDFANLVAAVLCETYQITGPTLESVFLANHKYYSRSCEVNPIWFDYIDIRTEDWREKIRQYPCYVKPAFLTLTLLQYRIETPEQLEKALPVVRKELNHWCRAFYEFFETHIDTQKYPVALRDILIVEELVENASQHVVEGWVDDKGAIYIWSTGDSNYYSSNKLAVNNYVVPSQLPPSDQEKMIELAKSTIRRHGLENTFWNVELWRKGEGYIVTEVNARSASVWHFFYLHTFGKSLYKAMTHLSCAEYQACLNEAPTDFLTSDRLGGQFHVITFGEGIASEFLDFDFIRRTEVPKIEVFVDETTEVKQTRTSGFWLARFELYGNSYQELSEKADELRQNLLKKPELSPH